MPRTSEITRTYLYIDRMKPCQSTRNHNQSRTLYIFIGMYRSCDGYLAHSHSFCNPSPDRWLSPLSLSWDIWISCLWFINSLSSMVCQDIVFWRHWFTTVFSNDTTIWDSQLARDIIFCALFDRTSLGDLTSCNIHSSNQWTNPHSWRS